jgi:Cation transporter/ATPase, N-terminus
MIEAQDLALAGLTSQEAAQRPATDGPNELPDANQRRSTAIVKGRQTWERAARPGYDASSGQFARRAAMR